MPANREQKRHKSQKRRTATLHARRDTSDSSINVVGFGNLRVIIVEEDGMWFAQCLDINYAAQGSSLDEVKRNFERGLASTVDEHLRVHGHIRNLMSRPVSSRVRQQLMQMPTQAFGYSQVTLHRLPKEIQNAIRFEGIEFIRPVAA
jgi:hypothetical protein